MFDCFQSRVTFKGTLTAQTAFRIGAGKATGVTGTDLPVVRDAMGKPYIPGSSFKGALRAYVESAMRALPGGNACDPLDGGCISAQQMQEWQRRRRLPQRDPNHLSDEQLAEQVYNESCDVCRVFGSPWLASKVSIRDLLVEESLWFGQFEIRNGVALDRDTETASTGLLYDFEVVPAGTQFKCEIVVENADDWELGLLLVGLRPFERGEAALGGARSRGLGVVKIDWDSRTRVDANNLLDYLAGDTTATAITDEDVKGWLKVFRDRLGGERHAQATVQ